MANEKKKVRVLLFGDRVNDTYLLPKKPRGGQHQFEAGSDMRFDWENHPQWFRYRKLGGVLMSQELLSAWYHEDIEVATSCPHGANNKPSSVGLESLAEVGHCDANGQEELPTKFEEIGPHFPSKADEHLALRVKRPIGYSGEEPISVNFRKVDGFDDPAAVIINDAGGELRFSPTDPDNYFCKLMDQIAAGDQSCDLIMKMHLPFREKLAWQKFSAAKKAKSRHLVIHAEDLRADRIHLSRCPSWDRCVEDILAALKRADRKILDLVEATDSLIILFDVEGALLIQWNKPKNAFNLRLIYDPESAEGETAKTLPGDIVGKMNAFIVTYTHSLLCDVDADPVVRGLEASRRFGESTYSVCGEELGYPNVPADLKARPPIRKSPNYQSTSITYAPGPEHKTVSLLAAKIAELSGKTETDLASEIVLNGVETTLSSLPHGQFGKLWTVDREEIEAMRDIDQLIGAYINDLSRSKPMSLAVFGPPGAGKSFGVKQLIDKNETPICEFNLSQADFRQLPAFFHEIRDLNLQGKTPLCFFDEFDSQNRSLIKYFLAPMQDGTFLDDEVMRPVGRGIFVFAGGTAATMAQFAKHTLPEILPFDANSENASASTDFSDRHRAREEKLPDFVSRLHGFINVKGPNAVDPILNDEGAPTPFTKRASVDKSYVLRRGILLRRFIEAHHERIIAQDNKKASIEPCLLNALLGVEDYIHGARSMELLIRSLGTQPETRQLGLSDLPIEARIRMFVHPYASFENKLLS